MDQASKPGPSRKSDEELRLEHGIDRECRVVLSSAFVLEHGDSLAVPNKVFRVHYGHHYLWQIASSFWDYTKPVQKVDLDLLYDNFIDNRFSSMDRPLFKRILLAYFGKFEEHFRDFRDRRARRLREALAEFNAKRKQERYAQRMVKITYRGVIAIAARKNVEKVKNAIRDNARVVLERQSLEKMLADAQLTTAAASNSDPPAGTSNSDPPAGTSNSDSPAGISNSDPPAGTSNSDPSVGTSKCDPPGAANARGLKRKLVEDSSELLSRSMIGIENEENRRDPPTATSNSDPPAGTSKCDPAGIASARGLKRKLVEDSGELPSRSMIGIENEENRRDPPAATSNSDPPAGTSYSDPSAGTSKCDPAGIASARGLKRKLVEDSGELPSQSMIGIENEENRRDPPAATSKCDPPAVANEGQSTAEVSNSDPPAGASARGLKRKLVEDSSELPSRSMIGIENEENRRDPPATTSKCDPSAAATEGQSIAEVSNSDPPVGASARGLKRKLIEDSSELPSRSMIGVENEENRPAIKVSDDCDDGTASNLDMSSAVPDDTEESPLEME